MIEREGNVRARHRQSLHHILARGVFAAGRAEELAPRRDLAEQVLDPNAGAGRQGRWPFGNGLAVVDDPFPARIRASRTAFQREARDAGDAGQSFAAEPQRHDLLDRLVGQLRRGVPFQRETHLVRRHAAAVVGDLEACQPAFDQFHRNPARTGIDRILDQFLERRGRPLNDFARSDAIDQSVRKAADLRHL